MAVLVLKWKIGLWRIAEVHIKALKECPDVDIVALADLVPGKAVKFFLSASNRDLVITYN